MRNYLLIIITFCSLQIKGQQIIPNVEVDYINCHKLISEKNFEAALYYMNDDLLRLVPKEKLINQFQQSFNKKGVTFNSNAPKIKNKTAVKLIGEDYYIKFTAESILEVSDSSIGNNEIKEYSNYIEKVYGIGNVTYNENNNTFIILVNKFVIGKFSSNQKNWKFITTSDKTKFEKMKFLPQEVILD